MTAVLLIKDGEMAGKMEVVIDSGGLLSLIVVII